jgi:hypothetical protein
VVELQLLNGIVTTQRGEIAGSPFGAGWSVAAVGDFNGDGDSDLVYRHAGHGLTELQLLNGTTPIGGGVLAGNPFDETWKIAGVGDFNGDGDSDLVWQQASSSLVEIELIQAAAGANGFDQVIGGGAIPNNPFGAGWNIVTTGDFNQSGDNDLVWQNASSGLVEIEFISAAGGANGFVKIAGGGVIANSPFDATWKVVGAGDFLSNGQDDLVYQRPSDGLVEIQYLNGINAVGGGAIANSPFGAGWQVVGVGDFNGDGKADLVYRNVATGTTEIQFLNGTTPIGGGVVARG